MGYYTKEIAKNAYVLTVIQFDGIGGATTVDKLVIVPAGTEPYGKMSDTATRLGCAEAKFTTYKQACREGWAPPPTNDVQKAIWDQVRQMPAKPIKIEFDPAKGK